MGVKQKRPDGEYYSVDIIPCKKEEIPGSACHDRYEKLSGKMNLVIETLTRVHVGTGDYESDAEGLYQPFARINDALAIPGAALKGVVRSCAEAVSTSCEGGACMNTRFCIGCRMFGGLGFQGRVLFTDSEPLDDAEAGLAVYRMRVRWGGGYKYGRRFYYHNKPGDVRAKDRRTGKILPQNEERVETVSWSVRFHTAIFFENLEMEEMGLLLLALGQYADYPFYPKLGGGKNRKLGSIRFLLPDGIQILDAKHSFVSFQRQYRIEDVDSWGNKAMLRYLDSLPRPMRKTALENLDAFNTEAGSQDE